MPDGGYVTTFNDISESKAIESALRDSERRVRAYTDNLPMMIAYLDSSRRLRFANKTYAHYVGLPRAEIVGRPLSEVLNAQTLMARQRYLDAALAGRRQVFEFEQDDPDGTRRYMLGGYIPDVDAHGRVFGIYATFQDITSRREAELALVEAKESLEDRVQERTGELNAALQELRVAKAAAEEAHASKTRFFAAAAHDLLQPINAAKLFSALLVESSHDLPAEPRRLVRQVETGLIAVEDLLNALLEISHLDAGTHVPVARATPLQAMFDTLETQFHESCRERGLRLRFVPTTAWVETDPALLRRVLQNFIGNAQRYTREGGILVGARRRGDQLSICVYDTGIGIDESDQEKIFEEFERLPNDDAGAERGIGLGLAIVQRIARLLGHAITMRSTPGRGSCFEVRVPRAVAPVAGVTAVEKPASAAAADAALTGQIVLCVDNEPDILDGMHALLSRWGLKPYTARDVDGARDIVVDLHERERLWPRLLLVDYQLDNGRTGLEVIERVRELSGLDIPAAVLTADRDPGVRERVEAAGHRIVYKPVKPAALRALITRMVRKSRAA
jgi:PAS domain S-box-containing protein